MAVSRRVRFEVLRRDGHTCRYCGASAPDVKLTVDHVIPVALGGGDEPSNLVTACQPCNAGKASTSPDEHIVEDVDATAMLMAKALQLAVERRRSELQSLWELQGEFYEYWMSWTATTSTGEKVTAPLDNHWAASIERFVLNGLGRDELWHFLEAAMRSPKTPMDKVWRYFCKCCWNEIGDRQELARRLVEDGEV